MAPHNLTREPITIFVQRGCLFSDEALAWLDQHHVPYTAKDIGTSPEVLQEMEALETLVTPTFIIGDDVIYGFAVEKLAPLLAPEGPAPVADQEEPRP